MTAPDDTAAVADLRRALSVTTEAAKAAVSRGDDAAFELVVVLDEAMTAVPAFGRALSALLVAGRPGAAVEADLRRYAEELQRHGRDVAGLRTERERLGAVEGEVRDRADEAERLRREVEELQRLERLAGQLDELRADRAAAEQHSGSAAGGAQVEEEAFAAAVRAVLHAGERATADLRVDVREHLARVAETSGQLTELRAEVAALTEERARDEAEVARLTEEIAQSRLQHEEVRARLSRLTTGWQSHLAADREIADVLLQTVTSDQMANGRPACAAVDEISEHVGVHLTQLDGLLRSLLVEAETRDQDEHRRRRMGSSAGPPSGSPSAQSPIPAEPS